MSALELQPLLRYREKLLGFIRKRVGDPAIAEDILQESLLKTLRTAPPADDDERFLAWFYRVLANAIVDYYRHRAATDRYRAEIEATTSSSSEFSPEAHAELCECFHDLMPSLNPEYARLIQFLELSEGDPRVIAREWGTSLSSLKVRRHRARRALRKKLEETCRLCAKHGCLDCTCSRD